MPSTLLIVGLVVSFCVVLLVLLILIGGLYINKHVTVTEGATTSSCQTPESEDGKHATDGTGVDRATCLKEPDAITDMASAQPLYIDTDSTANEMGKCEHPPIVTLSSSEEMQSLPTAGQDNNEPLVLKISTPSTLSPSRLTRGPRCISRAECFLDSKKSKLMVLPYGDVVVMTVTTQPSNQPDRKPRESIQYSISKDTDDKCVAPTAFSWKIVGMTAELFVCNEAKFSVDDLTNRIFDRTLFERIGMITVCEDVRVRVDFFEADSFAVSVTVDKTPMTIDESSQQSQPITLESGSVKILKFRLNAR